MARLVMPIQLQCPALAMPMTFLVFVQSVSLLADQLLTHKVKASDAGEVLCYGYANYMAMLC